MKKNDRSAPRDHRISTRQWLEVLDELNGAMIVHRQYRIQAINHCAQALIGMRLNEVVQCDCREVFTGAPLHGDLRGGDHHPPDCLYLSFRRIPRRDATAETEGSVLQEREAIAAALGKHDGHRGKAARDLGMDRTTLWRKMKRLGVGVLSKKSKASAIREAKGADKGKRRKA